MKELSIEEKAKAYDKALERARKLKEDPQGVFYEYSPKEGDSICDYIFPELKENEDERVRKALITFFQRFPYGSIGDAGTNVKEAIAWIEKQGSEPNWCHHKVDLSDYSEEYRKAYYDGWNNCNMQHSQCKSELDDVVKCLINGMKFYYEDNEGATWGTDKWSMPIKHIIEVLERQIKQKPANKIEPKFHEGDWVVSDKNNVVRIKSIDSNYYVLENTMRFTIDYVDKCWHLWTIADAKDGDVLVNDISVFIYAKVLYNKPYAYCGVDKFGVFKDNCLNNNWADSVDNIHPATKEQRNLLFKKTHEAGYEWNAEKKELGKIEQKLAWSEEDEYLLDETIKHLEALIRITKKRGSVYSDEIQYYQRDQDWLKSLKERIGRQIMKLIDKDAVAAEKSELKKLNGNKL